MFFHIRNTLMNVKLSLLRFLTAQELPSSLLNLTAGFSCKSFSKMHPNYQSLLKAMSDQMEESSLGK